MDSVSLGAGVWHVLELANSNGTGLPPTRYNSKRQQTVVSYPAVGTKSGQIDVVYEKRHEIAKSSSITLDLTSKLGNPVDAAGTGGAFAEVVLLQVKRVPNADASTEASLVSIGGSTSAAKLFFGSTSDSITLGPAGHMSWGHDAGVARGGTNLNIINLDGSNKATVVVFIAGRSA